MAQSKNAAIAQRLFHHFVAPLVLGGELTPGPPIGPRAGLSLGNTEIALDPFERTEVEVARVRVARQLVAIDVVFPLTREEWALSAALHDLVYALHPGLNSLLHRSAPLRLLDGTGAMLARISPPQSVADVVSRHTIFARAFTLQRTDTTVSWWVGSRTFLGTDPPPRLLAWPELRQVRTEKVSHTLTELSSVAPGVDRARFDQEVRSFLAHVPLTDLATAARPAPAFMWSEATLGFLATTGARSLGLRALELGPRSAVDAALGRATRQVIDGGAVETATHAVAVLGDRAMSCALSDAGDQDSDTSPPADVAYARTLGAIAATTRLPELALSSDRAARTASRLEALVRSPLGRELSAHFLAILGNAAGSAGGSSTSIDA